MAAGSKTPVTELQELCVRRNAPHPLYECTEDESTQPNARMFYTMVSALGHRSQGIGRSKKDSKHDAALRLLKVLLKTAGDDEPMDDDQKPPFPHMAPSDKVTELRDICVQRNFTMPEIECVRSSGPSHAPEFEFECRIGTIVRRGVDKTKKGAKQNACNEMIKILQAMTVEDTEMQVQSLDKAAEQMDDEHENVIRTYREYKNSDIKKKLGVKIADRHRYIEELDRDKIDAARLVAKDEMLSMQDKCTLIPRALGLKFDLKLGECQLESKQGQKLYSFELLNTEYDCFIFGYKDAFFESVYRYFMVMLNFNDLLC